MIFDFLLLDVAIGFISMHFDCSVLFGFDKYYHIWLWQQCLNSDSQQIAPISTKRTITSHLNQLNIKDTMVTYGVEKPGPEEGILSYALFNVYIVYTSKVTNACASKKLSFSNGKTLHRNMAYCRVQPLRQNQSMCVFV